MNFQLKRLENTMTQKALIPALVVGAVLTIGCGSADLAPCQVLPSVQGGYVVQFTLRGTAAAGCAALNPGQFSDWWAFNNDYPSQPQGAHGGLKIDYRSATMPPADINNGPPNGLFGYGTWDAEFSDANNSCTVKSLDPIQGTSTAIDGATSNTITYTPTELTFLSGAAYQGAVWKATVSVTVGTCTATYDALALSPAVGCSANKDCDPFFTGGYTIFSTFDQACFLTTTHPWTAGVTAALGSDGICFLKGAYPGLGGYQGNDQPLP